jgi:branched-chain amino acid transport system permease protein
MDLMDLSSLSGILITGLVRGGLYALMAVGLALMFGVMNIANFAHGEAYMLGAYVGFFAYVDFGLSPILAIGVAAVASLAFGFVADKLLFYSLRRTTRGDWLMNSFLVALGLSFVIKNGAQAVWGAQFHGISQFWEGSLQILPGVSIAYDRAIALGIALVSILGLWVFMRRTELGRAIRAVSQNERGALLMGIDLNRIYSITCSLSFMLAGLAGAAMLSILPAYPSVGGSILGGFLVGLLETVTYYYLGGGWQDVVSLCILILILIFKPSGIFGTTEVKGKLER